MKKIFFDEEKQTEFLSKGYITFSLLTPSEIEFLMSEIYKFFPPDGYASEYGYHTTFLDENIDYKKKATKLVRDFFSQKLSRILVDYCFPTGGLIIKKPNSKAVPIHRDWTFTDNLADVNLNFWCPLVDVSEKNGALQVVEGSHKIVQNIESPANKPFYLDYQAELTNKSTLICLKAGEAMLFENTIIHSSTPNNSDKSREVVSLLCIPQKARSVFYYPNLNSENREFKMYEMKSVNFDEHTGKEFNEGNLRTKVLSIIPNKNLEIPKEQFLEMLKNGDKIRNKIFFPDKIEPKAKKSWLMKMKGILGF